MNAAESLRVFVQGDREIVITRVFDAPRHMVFDAYTKPELLKRWLGVRAGWELAVCEVDLRVGGAYRYVWRNERKNMNMGAGGVYREIVPPERLVCTESFDDPWYPGESLLTTTLVEKDGATTLTTVARYESPEAREVVRKSPAESGLAETYDMLAKLLSTLVTAT
jgi:uncharacterized protein YndB with AHSA1/START domain